MDDTGAFRKECDRAVRLARPATLVWCEIDGGVIALVFAVGGGELVSVALGEPEALFMARSIHDVIEGEA